MNPHIIFAIAILIVVLVLGTPVPYAFGMTGLYLFWTLGYPESALVPVGFSKLGSMTLLAMPMFILVGDVIQKGKIGQALVDFVSMFVGKLRGGLGVVAVVSSAVFGAISGSSAATLSCIGSLMYPKMKEQGYDEGFATALILNSAPLGLFIPPSSTMLLYAFISGQSVLACFLATVLPGIILMILLSALTIFVSRKNPRLDPQLLRQTYNIPAPFSRQGVGVLRQSLPALIMPVIILGGIYGGVMTPTESAAIAVVYAIPVALFIYRGMRARELRDSFLSAVKTSGAVCGMLFTVMIFSRFLVLEDLPTILLDFMMRIAGGNTTMVLVIINVFMVIIGMLMDDGSGITLCTPILLPLVMELGISPIHFAAIIGVNLGMGCVTPPTAPLLYMGCSICGTPVNKALKPTFLMILVAWLPTLILTTYVPALSTTLPKLFGLM